MTGLAWGDRTECNLTLQVVVDARIVRCNSNDMNETSRYERSDELLSARQVVESFPGADFTEQTLRRWAREGLIASVRMPSGRIKFRRADVVEWLRPTPPRGERRAESGIDERLPGQEFLAWPTADPEAERR